MQGESLFNVGIRLGFEILKDFTFVQGNGISHFFAINLGNSTDWMKFYIKYGSGVITSKVIN